MVGVVFFGRGHFFWSGSVFFFWSGSVFFGWPGRFFLGWSGLFFFRFVGLVVVYGPVGCFCGCFFVVVFFCVVFLVRSGFGWVGSSVEWVVGWEVGGWVGSLFGGSLGGVWCWGRSSSLFGWLLPSATSFFKGGSPPFLVVRPFSFLTVAPDRVRVGCWVGW